MKKQKKKHSPEYLEELEAEISKHSLSKKSPRDKGFGKYKQSYWDGTKEHMHFIMRRQHVAGIKSALTKGLFVENIDLTADELNYKLEWICFSGKYKKIIDPRRDKMRETERKEFSKLLGRKFTKAEYDNMSTYEKQNLRKKFTRKRDK